MDPFVGEIRIFAGNFAPTGWALCNGQLLPISQNTALFSLLGTYYGGDGKSTFGLPDLQGRVALAAGQGPGLTDRVLGETSGSETVTLLATEMPAHTHTVLASSASGNKHDPAGNTPAVEATGVTLPYSDATPDAQMAPATLAPAGGNLPHNNLQPYLTMNYIIAMQGIYPPRS